MKNFELKFWLSCMMVALCIGFTSCGDDDDEGIAGDANTLIIGTWESTWIKGWEKYKEDGKWVTDKYDEAYTEESYTFKSGGKGTHKDMADNYEGSSTDFTWTVSGNKLKIVIYGYTEEYTIKTLNETTAVIIGQDKDEDGEEDYSEITLKKK